MEAMIGQIIQWTRSEIPRYFLPCDGRVLPIQMYQALYSLIGTKFGGDGVTNFALPDLRGRVVIGTGQQPGGTLYKVGDKGGSETVALTPTQIPTHVHTTHANSNTAAAASGLGTNNLLGTPGNGIKMYNTGVSNTTLNQGAVTVTGSGSEHENMQPYLVLKYLICVEGYYPPRQY